MRLKITLIAALLATTTAAEATKPIELGKSGYWEAVYSPEANACVLSTMLSSASGLLGMVTIKYFVGNPDLVIQVFKNTWRFPRPATPVPVVVGFDSRPVYDVAGLGYPSDPDGFVELHIEPAHSGEFMELFSSAKTMWVRFKQGNEPPWTTSMYGSRGAASLFARCIVRFTPSGQPTEPYSAAPTQPYGAPATQPYQSEPPRTNAPPAPKAAPAPQVDNGQI